MKTAHATHTLATHTLTTLTTLATAAAAITAAAAQNTPAPAPATPPAPKPPLNVLLFTADDMGWFSVAAFGSPAHTPGVTPNLDRFATQGMTFQRAHVTVAICQPSRAVLATGKYPHTSGVEGFFHVTPLKTIMSELQAHGYRTGVLGKCDHMTPDPTFTWDMNHDGPSIGDGRDPQKYATHFRQFLRDCKQTGKPFYFAANSRDPHRPWAGSPGDIEKLKNKPNFYPAPSRTFTPAEVKIPGFLPDLPKIREDLAQYCSSARRCDDTFGAIMKVLDEEGFSANTIVIFLSDNGISTPFAKTNAYHNSTRTPLIIRYPGVTKPGSTNTHDFVSGIDYMPTVLDACGYTAPPGVDGRSFLPLLRGEKQENRDRVYTQLYETVSRTRYPMFAVQDARYILIYNPWSDGKTTFRAESLGGLTFKAMQDAAKTDPFIRNRVELVQHRVPLELYDLQKDPNELKNLANDPAHAATLHQLSASLKNWMKQYDTTVEPTFAKHPDEKARNAYMTAQNHLAKAHDKRDKTAKKAGKKAKKTGQPATTTEEENDD